MKLHAELKSRWFTLLAIALCCLVAVHFLFDAVTAPKSYETINVFVTAKNCDNPSLNKALSASLDVKVTVSSASLDDKYYKESLQTSGLIMADLLVLPLSLLPENSIDKEFAPLNGAELATYGIDCADLEFYVKGNSNYAVKVYDDTSKMNLLQNWAQFEGEDYYLLINIARPNAGGYSQGTITTHNAFVALAVMLQPALT